MIERPITDWLPLTKKEVEKRGWEELDVILISGDAYVDHPAFGTAVIGRIIESEGFKIAIVAQPNWKDDLRDFKKLGKPKYFFGVTAGCMDSMVNHYTANKRLRSNDSYTPGGEAGYRPDYATTVYTKILKELYPDVPVLIGGIEASLRRVTHYDYWQDKLLPSILYDSGADMLVYGMGEQPLREILRLVKQGVPLDTIRNINQISYLQPSTEPLGEFNNWDTVEISSHEICLKDKIKYAANFKVVEVESNKWQANRIIQKVGDKTLVINPPFKTMEEKEMDISFDLPYTRMPHPKYKKRGPIPSYEMIKFSINMHRGCFGGCSFCTISAHQGKFIASRSEKSIMKEVDQIVKHPEFKGYISDLGGPSANMYQMKGKDESICNRCQSPSCIHPVICSNLDTSHTPLTEIYKKVDAHPSVKKAFVGSGVRYDLLVDDFNKNNQDGNHDIYMEQLITRHVSGRLKVAPEHTSDATLKVMRKPSFKYFRKFKEKYDNIQAKHNLKQPLIPYFISSHPGCEEVDMANLAAETKDLGFQLEQVQDFTPTPMTVAEVIYYSGVHPYTLQPIITAKTKEEKLNQNNYFFWYKPEFKDWIRKRLHKLNRPDLAERLLKSQKQAAIDKVIGQDLVSKAQKKKRNNFRR
ncbi:MULTISPECIES: YgiQ family radical SAM protein [unclassified Arcicella]|uniref:YgiQ family radical SAM protein n=1 Tax=unclassified Arcicella TaxID=2644986 RepID=UPI00286250A4|nr:MULTISPECIES: YgiQ family radical SAM protein [unclassified Arcicella]MDR6562423.1 putative radical SAM protein YgiQ [Arcicella sp. BE51]MDR6812317.1 putative radical SAM protein YgiQ [Arcicella sp. BE140]MDR6823648.1 putative radical SAM protein YgiQ [Arcicella sp. BE139]